MKEFLASKKVKTTLVGIVSIILINVLGLPEASAQTITDAIMVLIGLYLGAQGFSDGMSKGKTSSIKEK